MADNTEPARTPTDILEEARSLTLRDSARTALLLEALVVLSLEARDSHGPQPASLTESRSAPEPDHSVAPEDETIPSNPRRRRKAPAASPQESHAP